MPNTFTTALDVTKPAGTRSKLLGDDDIREFKVQFAERFNIDHEQPQTEAGDDNIGFHRKATLLEQGSDPAAVTDALILYAKLADSYSDLYCRHENAGVQRLTRLGKLWASALGVASEAAGDLLVRGASVWDRFAMGSASQQLRVNSGATGLEWFTPSSTFTSGMIMMWSGTIASIPSGWVICDGNNSTPNLTNRFVYGASDGSSAGNASPGQSGGAGTLAGNDSSVTYSFTYPAGPTSGPSGPTSPYSGSTQDVMPPYYALAFIMKT